MTSSIGAIPVEVVYTMGVLGDRISENNMDNAFKLFVNINSQAAAWLRGVEWLVYVQALKVSNDWIKDHADWKNILMNLMGSQEQFEWNRGRKRFESAHTALCSDCHLYVEVSGSELCADCLLKQHAAFQARIAELEEAVELERHAVSNALTTLGVDPSDWSAGVMGINAAVQCNLNIPRQTATRAEWGEVEKHTITDRLFVLVEGLQEVFALAVRSRKSGLPAPRHFADLFDEIEAAAKRALDNQ